MAEEDRVVEVFDILGLSSKEKRQQYIYGGHIGINKENKGHIILDNVSKEV